MKKKLQGANVGIAFVILTLFLVLNIAFLPSLQTGFARDPSSGDNSYSRTNGENTKQHVQKDHGEDIHSDTRTESKHRVRFRPYLSSYRTLYNNSQEIIDEKRTSFSPWKKYNECRKFQVNFAKAKTFPVCFLASFPGSGNTWTRYLIEASTGIFTGSDYTDGHLMAKGFYGENEPLYAGTTVAQKTHGSPENNETSKSKSKAILLIRNPYRAILAYHNYLYANHKLYAPISSFRSREWDVFVDIEARKWFETFNNWIKFNSNFLVIHFEDLATDLLPELEKIHQHLEIPVIEERLACLKKYQTGKFKRRVQHFPANLQIFSKEKRHKIDTAIEYLDFLLKSRNLTRPPLDRYEFYNGTARDKFPHLECFANETKLDCDDRIDRVNIGTWNLFNKEVPNEKNVGQKTPQDEKLDLESLLFGTVMKSLQSYTEDPIKSMIKKDVTFSDPKFNEEDERFPEFNELKKSFGNPKKLSDS